MLLRHVTRNGDTFGYNVRGEVVPATVGEVDIGIHPFRLKMWYNRRHLNVYA